LAISTGPDNAGGIEGGRAGNRDPLAARWLFRAYWRFKSGVRAGRPKTPLEIRQLIRNVSIANPLWGAPRIHGELLKLGIDVGQTTVAKYMASRSLAGSIIDTPESSFRKRQHGGWLHQAA
jgi:hypothetical protein